MSIFEEINQDIERKKAGMFILCNSFAQMLEEEAKANAKWKDRTAHARQSIKGTSRGGNGTYVVSLSHGVEYGAFLEEGTKPHIITPKHAQALYWRGAAHPVKQVNHPGTTGKPIIKPTVDKNFDRIKNSVETYWGR